MVWNTTGSRLRPKDPSLRRRRVTIRIAARQQDAAVAQPGFTHEVPRLVQSPLGDQKLPCRWVEYFHLFASASDEQPSRRQLHSFVGQFESAVIQGRCGSELSRVGIVDFSAIQVAVPSARIGATGNQHLAIWKQASRMLAAGDGEATSLRESSGLRII
jgi:hypothetical protein